MNARDLKPIHRALSPYFPGFVGHKRTFLKAPMNGLLRAIHVEPSAFDKASFYPTSLVMPLYVPREFLSLMFGDRLRHKTESYYWTSKLPNLIPDLVEAIREQGLPVLSQATTADGFIALGKGSRGNPHTEQSIAFYLARSGQRDHAVALIDEYAPRLNLGVQWEKEIFDLSTRLRDLLINDPEAADRQLQEWEDYTIQKLRLEAFR